MKKCWCGNTVLTEYSSEYLWCKSCNSLITKSDVYVKTDDLDDDKDFYGKQYWHELMTGRAKCEDCDDLIDLYLKERATYWLKSLYRFLLPGNFDVLEIGCGLGQLSYLLKCSGYNETAYELSPSICELIREKLNINIKNGAFKKNGQKYDAVIAIDLVEHLADPITFFNDISQSIKDDGIVLIQTPCFNEKISYVELKENNPQFLWLFSPNEHLFLYSRSAITRLLEENGLRYIQFIDAYFGNDYDMFVVASKAPLKENTEEQIKNSLYAKPYGRLINALIVSSEEKRKAESEKEAIRDNRKNLLGKLEHMTDAYKRVEENRDDLLKQLKNMMNDYNILEANRDDLLKQLKSLMNDYNSLEANRDDLLKQLKNMMNDYNSLEANRDDLLKQLKNLMNDYNILEANRDGLLEQISVK